MKKDIHPKLHPVVFVDSSCGAEFPTMSTLKSEKTKKINGVDHYVITVEVSSASHPFYTGEKMLVDTAGRVDKFRARMETAEKRKAEAVERKKKKEDQRKESVEEKITRKAKEKAAEKEREKAEEQARKEAAKKAKKTVAKKPAAKKKPVKKK
jgi:large subunit ribosomal protein L31